jgi:hypothetical protein
MNYKIEISRKNVTPAQFLAYIRSQCKKKGISIGFSLDDFVNPYNGGNNNRYYIKDNIQYSSNDGYKSSCEINELPPFKSEICKNKPYNYQVYFSTWDGSCFNEECEFTFDDDKTGYGYYFTVNFD